MAIDRPLKEVVESDLLALVSAGVREGKSIEFKREINLFDEPARRKFFASIASFANTQGGDIVFGVEAKDGVAVAILPLPNFNPDADVIRLRDLIRAHIEPKVYGFDFQAVELKDGGSALVLRIPRTWIGAHMVTYGQDNRFYVRDNNGKRIMDVGEVRMAFSAPETLPERIRRLRLDRLSAITGGDTPLPLSTSAAVVFHIFPVKAFDSFYECDLDSLISAENKNQLYLAPLSCLSSRIVFDIDGILKNVEIGRTQCLGYTKLFRNGVLEVVDCTTVNECPQRDKTLFAPFHYESKLNSKINEWLEAMSIAHIDPPAFVALSLIGMIGRMPYVGPYFEVPGRRSIRHDPLLLQPVIIESLRVEPIKVLMPVFNRVWQACGAPRSISFDENGKWRDPISCI
jgi:hypothetical protein